MHPKKIILTGRKIGQLTILSESGNKCIARCDCGITKEFWRSNILAGYTTKCHRVPFNKDRARTLYCWSAMMARCYNRANPAYETYSRPWGHISVCKRWHKFKNFLADMGYLPVGMTLERIDNNGNYQPSNCKWATKSEQSKNTRSNVRLTFQGRTQTVSDWASELGINRSTLYKRLNRSEWTVERALSTL